MQSERSIVPAQVRTELDRMNLLDRFLFNETVEDADIYNAIVEILMDEEITMTDHLETEKELRVSPQLRQIRLDVIGVDEAGAVYQMEMQKENTYNLRKRSRFYQSQIDVSLLKPGCTNFNNLNDVTTILVAPFDIFGYQLYRYTFEEYCQEVPGLKLEDGARRIFINTHGKNPEDFSQEFLDFMKYINESTDSVAAQSESARIRQIHKRVQKVRASEKMGVKLMQHWEEIAYAEQKAHDAGYTEGHIQGHIQGRTEGELSFLVQQICCKLKKNLSYEEIADQLEIEISKVQNICSTARLYAPDYDVEKIIKELLKKG